ncbi:MAG: rhodanese-like domain-containing protein [Bacteroidota bacterium]|nr:rhodanese-like domain-containing protein [Bacteroidota bacterium]
MKKLFLSLSILILVACSPKIASQEISVEEFSELLAENQDLQILDVRTLGEFAQGHIKGAKNHHVYDKNFLDNIQYLDKSKPVYVYCKVGGRSAEAVEELKNNGFQKVYDLSGGIMQWKEKGFDIQTTNK